MEIKKTYKYRLYPSKDIAKRMEKNLEVCRRTYNDLLSINQETYLAEGKGLSKFDMNKCINHGVNAEIKSVHSQVLQTYRIGLIRRSRTFLGDSRKGNQERT